MESLNLGNSKNGIPIFVHLVRLLIHHKKKKKKNNEKDFALIEFDISNAFNEISRIFMRKVCFTYFPRIIKYFDLNYSNHSPIFFSNNLVISSQKGFQQGDGLSVMFALCLYHLFHNEKEYKNLYFCRFFFHDDGRALVPISEVEQTISFFSKKN